MWCVFDYWKEIIVKSGFKFKTQAEEWIENNTNKKSTLQVDKTEDIKNRMVKNGSRYRN